MPEIYLDLDRDRIKTVLGEAYDTCTDVLNTDFKLTKEEFVSKIDVYLDSNRVSIPVKINLTSQKYPELVIEVDLRRKSVIGRMRSKNLRFHLNKYLAVL